MATNTDVRTENFIFKDQSTYLNQSNWSKFFSKALLQGFSDHVGKYNSSSGKYEISQFEGIISGLHFSSVQSESLDPVTQAEVDCLYCLDFDGTNSVKLVKVTNISQSADAAIGFLANLLYYYGRTLINAMQYIQMSVPALNNPIPLAYAIYGHGYYDLTRVIPPYDNYYPVPVEPDSSDTAVATPYCGYTKQSGLAQIYGQHRYTVNIDASYTLGEYRLYPVPAVSMDSAEIYIKNNTSGSITIKLPLSYRDMYFDYLTDSNWTESSGFKCYTLTAGDEMFIKMTQAAQEVYTSGGVNYPKSVFEISRGMQDVVYNDVYSKAEADALFETQTAATAALALKADASDVYTKTAADNLLADKADASDVYTKTEADNKFETITDATTALAAKADASDTYTKAEVDALIEDIPVISTVYTKTQTDELLASKADASDVYSKSATDTLLDAKANAADVYSKSEADELLSAKANASDVYTKAQADTLLSAKVSTDYVYSKGESEAIFAPKYSPEFTGQPKAPTAAAGTNTTQLATTAFVQMATSIKANTNSPTFTGTPKAPTPIYGDNSTRIATTEYVQNFYHPESVEIYVNGTTGSDTTGDGSQATPFKTIQKGIDTFPHGVPCTLYVAPDTYNEAIVISGKIVTIRSTMGAGSTIYDRFNGNVVDYALKVTDGSLVYLYGNFTFWSTGDTIAVEKGAQLIYAPSDYYVDKLTLIDYNGTGSAAVIETGLSVFNAGRVTIRGKIHIEFEGTMTQRRYGIDSYYGSFVSVENLEFPEDAPQSYGATVAIYNHGSIVTCGSISGNYTTASTTEAGGITNIGTEG